MKDEVIKTIKEEHKLQGEKIKLLDNLFKKARRTLDSKYLGDLDKELRQVGFELKEHFYTEETDLFPQIKNNQNKQLIDSLEREHLQILSYLEDTRKYIKDVLEGQNKWVEMRYSLGEFLHLLNDHILKEDYQLLVCV